MLESLQNISKQLSEFWNNLDKSNKRRIIIISAILLSIIMLTTVILNRKEYVVLYSNLDPKDAGEIMTILSDMGVEAKTQGADTFW